jgi:hypothetical protein
VHSQQSARSQPLSRLRWTIIDGDKWTAQQATKYKRKLNAALDKQARAEPPPGDQIYATAAFLIDDVQFISVMHPISGQKKKYH